MENIENTTNPENTTVTITIPAEDAPVAVEETPVNTVDYETLYKNEKTKNKVLFGTGIAVGAGSAVLLFKYRGAMKNLAVTKKARKLEKKAKKGNEKAKAKLVALYEANEELLKDLIEDPRK